MATHKHSLECVEEYQGNLVCKFLREKISLDPQPAATSQTRAARPASVPFNLERFAHLCPKYARKKLNKEQREALGYYTFCLKEEDRYGGSVFCRPGDPRSKELEAKSSDASSYCKTVGIAHP